LYESDNAMFGVDYPHFESIDPQTCDHVVDLDWRSPTESGSVSTWATHQRAGSLKVAGRSV
jgi:hypothetical protein